METANRQQEKLDHLKNMKAYVTEAYKTRGIIVRYDAKETGRSQITLGFMLLPLCLPKMTSKFQCSIFMHAKKVPQPQSPSSTLLTYPPPTSSLSCVIFVSFVVSVTVLWDFALIFYL
jgi:hypothetical protein